MILPWLGTVSNAETFWKTHEILELVTYAYIHPLPISPYKRLLPPLKYQVFDNIM